MRSLLAIALLALLLAGCATPATTSSSPAATTASGTGAATDTGSSGPAPPLKVGQKWTLATSSGGATSTIASEVQAIEDHAGASAYRIAQAITAGVPGATSTSNATSWTRVSDGASLETDATFHLTYGGQTMASSSTTTYSPPCRSLRWPLAPGATWSVTCTSTTTSNGQSRTTSTTTTYAVGGQESVTVPAGTFNAYKVTVDGGSSTTTEWVDPTACAGIVKTSSSSNGQIYTGELQSESC
jgi:hypothetical protein